MWDTPGRQSKLQESHRSQNSIDCLERQNCFAHDCGQSFEHGVGGVKPMLSRVQCALLALCLCASLVGCAEGDHVGDWLWWPSLTPITSAYIDQVPVHDVALEVQCEIYQFLGDKENAGLLDPNKGAGVVLTLQTDLSGSVQYTGIDLSKLGFPSLAELVAASNKLPTLQAKGTGSTTVSAEVDFTVAQSKAVPRDWNKKSQDPQMIIKVSDESGPWENAKFSAPSPKKSDLAATPIPPPQASKANFQTADCSSHNRPWYAWYLKLSLDDWLKRYSSYAQSDLRNEPFVCGTKVTLKSSFKILMDVSAGVNAFMTPPIILPISGFNVDASPDYTHSIAVTFALKDNANNGAYCAKIGAGAQPSTK
jgi:hypothetical protein